MERQLAVDRVATMNAPYPRPGRDVRVMVIGGGLAGMSAALRLAKHGFDVSLYEKSARLGGKAGSNKNAETGQFDDHGFHIFPGWYLNIWKLVDELEIRDHFVDLHDFFQLRERDYVSLPVHRFKTLHDAPAWWNLWRNLRSSPLSVPETLLFFYSTLDLATHRLSQSAKLDQISITGFLHSKFYSTAQMATVYQDLMLKAISVPAYFVSAATTRHVIRYWLQHPAPMHFILRGNLQQFFIEPFQKRLAQLNVKIYLEHELEQLTLAGNRIIGVEMKDVQSGKSQNVAVDQIVIAVPPESLPAVCPSTVYKECSTLGNARNLRTRPMAALNLYFNHRIPNLPASHVNLIDSKFGLTFIDVARIWDGWPGSILNIIATDYSELEGVNDQAAAEIVIRELQRFIPFDRHAIVNTVKMESHLNAPLFMNDVGIWHFRPKAVPVDRDDHDRVEIENLFLAGDYCQSHVDLVSMESAYTTGFLAGEALAKKLLNTEIEKPEVPEPISAIWWLVWLIGLPFAALLKLVTKVFPTRRPVRTDTSIQPAPGAPRMRT